MPSATEENKCRLVETLLHASGQEEVKSFIDTAVEGLEGYAVNSEIVISFAEKMINELEQFSPMNKEFQQWSNIKMARIYLNRIRRRVNETFIKC